MATARYQNSWCNDFLNPQNPAKVSVAWTDYDDVSLLCLQCGIDNSTDGTIHTLIVTDTQHNRTVTVVANPGQHLTQPLPASGPNRLFMFRDTDGTISAPTNVQTQGSCAAA